MAVFFGRVCKKHPELNGRRYDNEMCCECHKAQTNRRRRERSKEIDDGDIKIVGKVCAKHPQMEGLRYNRGRACVECAAENSRKQYEKRKRRNDQQK